MTTAVLPRLALLAFTLAAALPCAAESSTSSASSAGSASIGSLSDSIHGSSNSSSRDRQVADGDYRIEQIAEAGDRPGVLRLTMQAVGGDAEGGAFQLDLPRETFAKQQLALGDVVGARRRAYGLEFARADTREPFFLVLDDAWHGELDPRVVTL